VILEWIQANRDLFGVEEIRHPEFLSRCRQTGFSLTSLPDTLCVAAKSRHFQRAANNSNIRGIVTSPEALDGRTAPDVALVLCRDPESLFYSLHNQALHECLGLNERWPSRIDPTARIHPLAYVPETNVEIGPGVEIGPRATLFENVAVGEGSVIMAGCVIGAEALSAKRIRGDMVHLRQYGGVRIGKGCRLHAGAQISRATHFGEWTVLGDQVQLGTQALVGHDCTIGSRTIIAPQAFTGGRNRIGQDCWIGARAALNQDITIGDGARVNIGAVVIDSVPSGAAVSGPFAVDHARNIEEYRDRLAGGRVSFRT